jgi:sterol desaturase/sphingolipid hydroxylase (fatty acid hydroxylase superfamily)
MQVIGIFDLPVLLATYIKIGLTGAFIDIEGALSLAKLALTLSFGILAFVLFHQRKSRNVRFKALIRAIFPKRFFGASSRADVMMMLFNIFLVSVIFGWAFLSQHSVARFTNETLQAWCGALSLTAWSQWQTSLLLTLAMFLAYEFGYWLDHYLSHRVPFLWEFHKVHHAAEVLTPITNFRVHPMDSIVFYNIIAMTMGVTEGSVKYMFGSTVAPFTLLNSNVLFVLSAFLIQQLQHTHFWIPFTGIWGKIFLSPAHHQIHHSLNPIHFDKNMGGTLSLFDWLFGTLHIPSWKREKLTFGVDDTTARSHTAEGLLVSPVIDAAKLAYVSMKRSMPDTQPSATTACAEPLPRKATGFV